MEGKYTCKMCNDFTGSKEELKKHNKEVHGDEMAEAVDKMEPDGE